MSVHYIFGIIAAILFSISYIPYIYSIIKGFTKPHPISWMLWAVIGGVTFYFSIKAGANETLPLIFLNFILPLVVGLLSLRYFTIKFSKFDYVCLLLSAVSIILYLKFRNIGFAITLNVLSDMFAYLPTLIKTYNYPKQENLLSWILYLLGYIFGLFAISKWTYDIAIYPVYLVFFGIIMCSLILRGRLKKDQNIV